MLRGESTASQGRQRKVMEYSSAEIMVGMDDETNRLIDAPDVREHWCVSVDRINLRKCWFGYQDTRRRQLAYTYVLKIQEVTRMRVSERERFQKQISSIVQFSRPRGTS